MSEEDSLLHLFFRCTFAGIARRSSFWPLNSLAWAHLSPVDWIKGILNSSLSFGIPPKDTHLFQIFTAVLCDFLWFHRNKAAHDDVIPDILVFVSSIKKLSMEHFAAWRSVSSPILEKLTHPLEGSYKINFDTAIRRSFLLKQRFAVTLIDVLLRLYLRLALYVIQFMVKPLLLDLQPPWQSLSTLGIFAWKVILLQ